MSKKQQIITGGDFLIRQRDAELIFIPEEFNEEQQMIAQMCRDFIEQEVLPKLDEIDATQEGLLVSLLDKAGQQGILGISVPEEYGGFGKDYITSMLATEALGSGHSFTVAYATHTGIGTLPLLYYGSKELKEKYLPKLATGEQKACYCLTEPDAGSDANAGKTKATLSDDGKHYILNGQKMWITNAGFGDLFTVFAKIDDDKNLSAFIVEKDFGGITINPEEKKMGIKGSSTCQVFFSDCKVPIENLLGKRDEGFKIALNILNIGRIKLAAATNGGSKDLITHSVHYSNERKQFSKAIASFGAIKYKLAEQSIRTFACESALYRCSGDIQKIINEQIQQGIEKQEAILEASRQFAPEAAILKVLGSEVLDYVVDEAVQIYGGMGYSAIAPVERAYRDARINRIFEGTNEINRLLIVDMLLKKAMKGEIDLMSAAKSVADELMSIPDFSQHGDGFFEKEKGYISNFKKAILMVAGAAVQKFMTKLADEQEILINLADMIINLYTAESILLRTEKMNAMNRMEVEHEHMVKVFLNDSAQRINIAGINAISSFSSGDELRIMMMGLKRFTKIDPINTKEARRCIADKMIKENKYCY